MTRTFCDRCRQDVTDIASSSVSLVLDASFEGAGQVTNRWDVCRECASALIVWMTSTGWTPKQTPKVSPPAPPKKTTKARR